MYDFASLKNMAKIPQEEEEDRIEEECRQEEEEEFQVLCPPISLKNLQTLWDKLWVPLSSSCSCGLAKPIYTILPITKYKILAKLA